MFNQLLLYAALTSIQCMPSVNTAIQTSYVQQYEFSTARHEDDKMINTMEMCRKDERGAFPWEIVKPYGDSVYFLYENYFRIGHSSICKSKTYNYFQSLSQRRPNIVHYLINPVDYRCIRYFDINNMLRLLPRQIVLDLQKEVLDFKQTVLDALYPRQ